MISSFSFDFSSVYTQLTSFAKLENFWSPFDTAFGSSYDFATAASLRSQWQSQDFSLFPQIEVVSSEILGSAKGAYAISTNRIYLSDQFVSVASQQSLDAVILEEFGHFVDAQVNATDTPGDEGELFSDLVIKNDDSYFKIAFDYSFDTSGFFTQERRNTLESAAKIWESFISDDFPNLAAGTNVFIVNPEDAGNILVFTTFVTLPAVDDLLIYVGSDSFSNSFPFSQDQTLAVSYPVQSPDSNGLLSNRYNSSNFEPWVGTISFNSSTPWFFDQTPNTDNDIPSSQTDFLYVALHEIGHILGLGDAPISKQIGAGGSLKSPNDLFINNNQPIPLESDLGHIKEGFANDLTLMDPFINRSVGRLLPTQYDLAWLEDIGYQLTSSLLDNDNITLAVTSTSVTEDGATNLVYTFTRTGATTNALTVNYSISGTADNSDYTGATTGTGKTITFAANSATATLTLDPTADTTIEPDETAILTLASGKGYTIGTTTTITGTITNDDLPAITLAVSSVNVIEDAATNLVYTFTRTGPIANALTVTYGITGTADSSDYTGATPGTSKTITFAANSATATLTLDPTADTTIEPDETAILTLATGTGYTIGTTTPITGTITNDDVASYGSKLTTPIIRFRNNDKPGTYLFAGEQEAISIRKNNKNFVKEGIAFPVAVSKTDPLMQPFYRFKNTDKGREGTYLFAGEQEAASIRKSYKNFVEEGLAFYAFPAGVGGGTTDFMRFQNKSLPGTYLFTGPSETKSVLTNPGFILEGSAFAAGG